MLAGLVETFLTMLLGSSFHTRAGKGGTRTRSGILMSYPRSFIVLWTLFPWVWVLILIIVLLMSPRAPVGVVLGPVVVFLSVISSGFAVWWEARNRKILITDSAVIQLLRGGRMRRIRWEDVTRVSRGVMLGGFVVTDGKRRILVSEGLTGRSTFARLALDRVPRSATSSCEHVLRDTAAATRAGQG